MRGAVAADTGDLLELIAPFVAQGLLLPRTAEEIEGAISDYVVVVDAHGRVRACAALCEYSPSLAEVCSVAVAPDAQGLGLGSLVVQGVEAMARERDLDEVFALTLADGFFLSLGYEPTSVDAYPEKLSRYAELSARGVAVQPKRCFRKVLG